MVFIDGSNVYHAFRTVFGSGKYDVAKLASELVGDRPNRQLVTAHYYIARASGARGTYCRRVRGSSRSTVACGNGVGWRSALDVSSAVDQPYVVATRQYFVVTTVQFSGATPGATPSEFSVPLRHNAGRTRL